MITMTNLMNGSGALMGAEAGVDGRRSRAVAFVRHQLATPIGVPNSLSAGDEQLR